MDSGETIDFESAEVFLKHAKEAHERGDMVTCMAARKLVAIALNLSDELRQNICTNHLRDG